MPALAASTATSCSVPNPMVFHSLLVSFVAVAIVWSAVVSMAKKAHIRAAGTCNQYRFSWLAPNRCCSAGGGRGCMCCVCVVVYASLSAPCHPPGWSWGWGDASLQFACVCGRGAEG